MPFKRLSLLYLQHMALSKNHLSAELLGCYNVSRMQYIAQCYKAVGITMGDWCDLNHSKHTSQNTLVLFSWFVLLFLIYKYLTETL